MSKYDGVFKVSYADGDLFALVRASTAAGAVEMAKVHRAAKYVNRTKEGRSRVARDIYTARRLTPEDLELSEGWGLGIITDFPVKKRKRKAD